MIYRDTGWLYLADLPWTKRFFPFPLLGLSFQSVQNKPNETKQNQMKMNNKNNNNKKNHFIFVPLRILSD